MNVYFDIIYFVYNIPLEIIFGRQQTTLLQKFRPYLLSNSASTLDLENIQISPLYSFKNLLFYDFSQLILIF